MRAHSFIKNASLFKVAHKLQELGAEFGWLFVTIDSCRGSFEAPSKSISNQLKANGIIHQWGGGGLWLHNGDILNPFVQAKILVPFSAGYIFFEKPAELPSPSFNRTTDSGEAFSDNDLAACFAEIDRVGAAGYAADGVGLQCLFADDQLPQMNAETARSFWFWAWLKQITIKKADLCLENPKGEVWRNLHIVQAHSAEEAIKKSMRIGECEEGDSKGSLTLDEEPAITKFLGIEDIGMIHEDLSDGSEILFRSERASLIACKQGVKENEALRSKLAAELRPYET